jgi:putative DNA primase/helicase
MTGVYSNRLQRKSPSGDFRYPTAAEVAAVLRGKRRADGSYLCSCPGPVHRHGDRNPSLSVKDGRNGRALLHCFAGCRFDEIVTALRGRGLRA